MKPEENRAAVEKMLHDFISDERWKKALDEKKSGLGVSFNNEYDEYSLPTAPNPFEQQEVIRL